MTNLNSSDLNDGAGLNAGTELQNSAELDGQGQLPVGSAEAQVPGQSRLQFGIVDQLPGTNTNPIYRYRDGQAALYRVPADGDQTGAIRLLLDRGYIK